MMLRWIWDKLITVLLSKRQSNMIFLFFAKECNLILFVFFFFYNVNNCNILLFLSQRNVTMA